MWYTVGYGIVANGVSPILLFLLLKVFFLGCVATMFLLEAWVLWTAGVGGLCSFC